jgi:selenocysteine lyase/cysteine desulfurase
LVTSRAGLLRVSPHIDNDADDVGMLLEALAETLAQM